MKYSNYYTFFIYLLIIILSIYLNPFSIVTKYTEIFIFIITLMGVILTSVGLYKKSNKNDTTNFILKLCFFIFSIFLFLFILFFITYFLLLSNFSLNIFLLILNIFIIIGLFTLGYKYFSKFLNDQVSGYLILELFQSRED